MSRIIPLVSGRNPAPYSIREGDFYIANGPQRYNRALYGAVKDGSRFSVFAGDVPEWMLYQAGGAGYIFLGVVKNRRVHSLADFQQYELRYSGKAVSRTYDPIWGSLTRTTCLKPATFLSANEPRATM